MLIASRISAMADSGSPTPPTPAYWGLYFEAEEAGCVVNVNKYDATNYTAIECSPDGATWTDFDCDSATGTTPVTLANIGDRVYFRHKGSTVGNPFASASMKYRYFTLSKKAKAGGNIMSLVKGDEQTTTIPNELFFYALFDSCANLTTPPELPATTLTANCYNSMFWGCTALTKAPELPATTLAWACYGGMFYGCTALTEAPDLPATTLAGRCYQQLFTNCTSLASIKVPFTSWPATTYTDNWVYNVASTGTFVCPTALGTDATIARGVHRCPSGWTVVNT